MSSIYIIIVRIIIYTMYTRVIITQTTQTDCVVHQAELSPQKIGCRVEKTKKNSTADLLPRQLNIDIKTQGNLLLQQRASFLTRKVPRTHTKITFLEINLKHN